MSNLVLADTDLLRSEHALDVSRWCDLGASILESVCRTEEDLIRECREARIIVYFGNDLPFTERALDHLTECVLIQRVGVGFDSVDVDAATERGIVVSNSAGYCDEDVANHALALLLACNQQIPWHQDNLLRGRWGVVPEVQTERLSGQTLGIVGIGRIGGSLCERARPLVRRILAHDPYVPRQRADDVGADLVNFDTLLDESDLISLHCPLNDKTRGMVGAVELEKMRSTASIVNTARGSLIDVDALYDALVAGRLRGAGLDVFPIEPLPSPLPDLISLPNVVVTPHAAAASRSSLEEMWRIVSDSVSSVLQGKLPDTVVNLDVSPRLFRCP